MVAGVDGGLLVTLLLVGIGILALVVWVLVLLLAVSG
jgi:hypothetical protein